MDFSSGGKLLATEAVFHWNYYFLLLFDEINMILLA